MAWAQRVIELIDKGLQEWLDEIINVARIPAPVFEEEERSQYIYKRLQEVALNNVEVDKLGNVIAKIPSNSDGPHIMLVAHMDTVFGRNEHIQPSQHDCILKGSSVKDNASGVGALISIARLLKDVQIPGDLTLAMSVGEEGLGNCRGMRELMNRTPLPDMVIAIDSTLGNLVTVGVASTRLKVKFQTEGGHSWGDAGKPSAINIAVGCIGELIDIPLSTEPKTTLNVGVIEGGVSINSIAPNAHFLLDMRSVDQGSLERLCQQVEIILRKYAELRETEVTWDVVGKRPGGRLPEKHRAIEIVRDVHSELGLQTRIRAVSTDANIALSMGVPAIAIGAVSGGNVHSFDEYMEIDSIPIGLKQIILILDRIWSLKSSSLKI